MNYLLSSVVLVLLTDGTVPWMTQGVYPDIVQDKIVSAFSSFEKEVLAFTSHTALPVFEIPSLSRVDLFTFHLLVIWRGVSLAAFVVRNWQKQGSGQSEPPCCGSPSTDQSPEWAGPPNQHSSTLRARSYGYV